MSQYKTPFLVLLTNFQGIHVRKKIVLLSSANIYKPSHHRIFKYSSEFKVYLFLEPLQKRTNQESKESFSIARWSIKRKMEKKSLGRTFVLSLFSQYFLCQPSDNMASSGSMSKDKSTVLSFRLGEADDFSFSEELQKAVFSVLPSKDPLDDPGFNAIDFINGIFPDGAWSKWG